jgi:branched-chain amino acid transport system substrate-binding protein
MGWLPTIRATDIPSQYLLQNYPRGKTGILYQNDDYGKDYIKKLKDALNGEMRTVADR